MLRHCYHCSETIPPNFIAEAFIGGESRHFCCYGCKAVADTIVSSGLEKFYQHRTQPLVKTDELDKTSLDEFKLYDEPEVLSDYLFETNDTSDPTLTQISLNVRGITCAACVWLLEKELNKMSGVARFNVNLTTHIATVSWNSHQLKLSSMLTKIAQLGYNAKPYREDQAKRIAKKEKQSTLIRIAIAGLATMQNMMFSIPLYLGIYEGIDEGVDEQFIYFFRWVSLLMCTPVVMYSAFPFFKAGLRDLKSRQLTMDTPISLAILAAYFSSAIVTLSGSDISTSEVYFDSVCMFTFFILLGRFVEMQTRHKHLNTASNITELVPTVAHVINDGVTFSKPTKNIELRDVLVVKQGEIIPADGMVIEGQSTVDESALSGEFLPKNKTINSLVFAGTLNVENTLHIEINTSPNKGRIHAIIHLLNNAQSEKPRTVLLANKVASYFVISVIAITALVFGFWSYYESDQAFAIALSVLVVTCPCALSLATPTALTRANNLLRRSGLLIGRSHVLETATNVTDIVFDKTGTLTEGNLVIDEVLTYAEFNAEQVLEIAAALEHHSQHPISQAFSAYFQRESTDTKTYLGNGIEGKVKQYQSQGKNELFRLGKLGFIDPNFSALKEVTDASSLSIFLSEGKRVLAQFILHDTVRIDSAPCIKWFQDMSICTHILSGDVEHSVRNMANQLGIDSFESNQSPEQKLEYVKQLQQNGKTVAMVGDGINDLLVLSAANLSFAMGEASDLAKINADAIVLNSQMSVLNDTFQTAFNTRKIIKQNISWAVIYNISMLPMAATGLIPPYLAALGMSVSSLAVIFNSLRLKKY